MVRCGSVGLIILAAACFVIATVAVAVPFWGHFRNRVVQETGHFGPWTICKDIDYGRKMCGHRIVMFKPGFQVYAAGVCAAVGVTGLGAYGLFSIFYMTLMCSPHSTLRRYKIHILVTKLILSLISALTAWTSVGLFATQGDVLEHGYIITVGFSFYMEIVVAIFSTILMLLTIAEYVSARREPDDVVDTSSPTGGIGLKNVITNPALTYSRGDQQSRGRRGSPGSATNGDMTIYKSTLPPEVLQPVYKSRLPPPEVLPPIYKNSSPLETTKSDEKQQVRHCEHCQAVYSVDEPLLPKASPSPGSRRKGRQTSLSNSICICEVCRFRQEHRLRM